MILLAAALVLAQAGVDSGARQGIAAVNQAWVEGMKRGDAKLIASSYGEDAVDCGAAGECIQGRAAIEHQLAERVAKLGRAASASVTSEGSVRRGGFIYEWGQAQASFPNGARVAGHYLTVWRKRAGGGWEIFRNLKIPD